MTPASLRTLLLATAAAATAACGPVTPAEPDAGAPSDAGPGTPDGGEVVVPGKYEFTSRFDANSSVAYGGQALRQVLIADLGKHIVGLTARVDGAEQYSPAAGAVVEDLNFFFFEFDAQQAADRSVALTTTPAPKQSKYAQIGSGNLVSKIAGNDEPGRQHKDWSTEFKGWSEDGVTTPESLVRKLFSRIEALVIDRANGTIPTDPSGAPVTKAHVTAEGVDLQQLLAKFLSGAVNFSQAADDYLDDDTAGKGLLADNTVADGANNFTVLEHAWDEAFGYFGAARDLADYTTDEAAGAAGRDDYKAGYHDTNGDGTIDLAAEFNFSMAGYTARRDRGSKDGAKTEFRKRIFDAFLKGRALITAAGGALTAAQLDELRGHRDDAVEAWEETIAASIVSYLNGTLRAVGNEAGYSFTTHAAQWSEGKGLALGLQFNPRAKISDAQLATLNEKLGQAPVLPGQPGLEAHKQALRDAKALLQTVYGFAAANMGDDAGVGGW